MSDLTTVVCATDLSEGSNKALYLAAFIAERFQAKLVVANIIDLPAVTPYGETMVDPQELQARVTQSATSQISEILTGYPEGFWELRVSIGYPTKELKQIVHDTGAGLLVAATHIRSGFERLLLGSVTRKLIGTINVPFLVVPGALPFERRAIHRTESILISTDFSSYSEGAVKIGLQFARTFGVSFTLVTVMESSQLDQILNMDPQKENDLAQKFTDELKSRLYSLIPDDLRDKAKVQVLAGHPHEELNKFAILNDMDLIVVGIHGRGFIENFIVGSTTDRLVRVGQFPVLAVRAEADKVS
ncbi:MAG: universal stress protein [Deltaproteobacteria bacterium]|jgi:nucleotide-binding universal stress UspA family protein|nr:universal stress protein [Deltaproteobacteria bacterium]